LLSSFLKAVCNMPTLRQELTQLRLEVQTLVLRLRAVEEAAATFVDSHTALEERGENCDIGI